MAPNWKTAADVQGGVLAAGAPVFRGMHVFAVFGEPPRALAGRGTPASSTPVHREVAVIQVPVQALAVMEEEVMVEDKEAMATAAITLAPTSASIAGSMLTAAS